MREWRTPRDSCFRGVTDSQSRTFSVTCWNLEVIFANNNSWVFSDKLPTQQRNGHTWYALANTTSGQVKEGFSWKISYGDGSGASGIVLADKVTVGEVTATQQAIEAATSVSSQFIQEKSDGLLGLGFGNTNTIKPTKQLTFFENIKPSLKEPLFTVTLKLNESGVYDFGYVDKAKYVVGFFEPRFEWRLLTFSQEPIQYVPINTTRGYWEYTATGYAVGTGPMTPMNFQSIADTGTTLMLLPPAATADYYSQVKGAMNNMTEGGYVFPCDAVMPDLTVQMLGNVSAVVSGKFMNRSKSQTPGSPFCYGGIQQGSPNLSIWGDVFLKSQFAVFDGRDPPRIGFAKQSGSLGTPLPPANASLPLAQGGNTAVSGSQSGTTRPDPLNWMGYFLKLAKKFGIVPEVHGNGVIAQKRSMRWRHRVVEAY